MSVVLGIHYGISSGQHDVGACLVKNGNLKHFIEEERLLRVKTARGRLPIYSIKKILELEKITMKDIDLVVFPGKTYIKNFNTIKSFLNHYFGHTPKLMAIEHHLAHLSSAFFHSDFNDSAILSIDGVGDNTSVCIAIADKKNGIKILEKRLSDSSFGHYYGLITSFLGFAVAEDEYKIMGLAPFGNPNYTKKFEKILKSDKVKGFKTNLNLFKSKNLNIQLPYYNQRFIKNFGKQRCINEKITRRHENLAASAQKNLENLINSLINYTSKKSKNFSQNLCLVGGVALNCLANGKINNPKFKKIFVEPAASDRGLAMGCGLYGSFLRDKKIKPIKDLYLGTQYTNNEIKKILVRNKIKYKILKNPELDAAKKIFKNKVVGWFQGRSEMGPRALGNRSILANPTLKKNKDMVNKMIKFREKFRPFAPAVMDEFSNIIFDNPKKFDLKYMTFAIKVKKNWIKKIPATVHFGTARVQSVSMSQNKKFYKLIKNFYKLSKVPVVLNTSFNLKGQPIVETPNDALATFYSSGLDYLYLNSFLISK
jgi:carbamoyltransferase